MLPTLKKKWNFDFTVFGDKKNVKWVTKISTTSLFIYFLGIKYI